mmetsp:Transcript_18634/g.46520  ORF Transcript_18634/g.46520 Transcript_18634/m.46520 type:complete len:322 (+) Transcript_18634:133-1098(+)
MPSRSRNHASASGTTFITGTDLTENDAVVPVRAKAPPPVQPPRYGYAARGDLEPYEPEESRALDLVPADRVASTDNELEQLKQMVKRTRKKLDTRMSEMQVWRKEVDVMRRDIRRCDVKEDGDESSEDEQDKKGGGRDKKRAGGRVPTTSEKSALSSSALVATGGGGTSASTRKSGRGSGGAAMLLALENSDSVSGSGGGTGRSSYSTPGGVRHLDAVTSYSHSIEVSNKGGATASRKSLLSSNGATGGAALLRARLSGNGKLPPLPVSASQPSSQFALLQARMSAPEVPSFGNAGAGDRRDSAVEKGLLRRNSTGRRSLR